MNTSLQNLKTELNEYKSRINAVSEVTTKETATIKEITNRLKSVPISVVAEEFGLAPAEIVDLVYGKKKEDSAETITQEIADSLWNDEGKYTITELANRYEIKYHALYHWIRQNHYIPKPASNQKKNISDENQQFIREHSANMSISELSQRTGCSFPSIRRFMIENDLESKNALAFTEEELEKILEFARAGKSARELAEMSGITLSSLRNRLKKHGFYPDGTGYFFIVESDAMKDQIIEFIRIHGMKKAIRRYKTTHTGMRIFMTENHVTI